MSEYSYSGGTTRERQPPRPTLLREAFQARTKGEIDVITSLASACGIQWEEAIGVYIGELKKSADALFDRINAKHGR